MELKRCVVCGFPTFSLHSVYDIPCHKTCDITIKQSKIVDMYTDAAIEIAKSIHQQEKENETNN